MSQRGRSNRTLSQRNEAASSSQAEVNIDVVNKCVRFLLTRMNTNIPIKKTDIVKHAFPKGSHKTYEAILSKTKSILDDVYGLNLEVIDCDSTKRYIVSNALPVLTNLNVEEDQSLKSVVMLLVLAHIYMSRNSATDLSLWKFLNEFKFMRDSEIEEGLTVKQFVTKTLVKQQYICMENRGGEHEDGQLKMKFIWGPHAEYSISKLSVLQFVASYNELESEGYRVLMPAFKGNCKQLPTFKAYESRFVTKLRWVVEALHGRIASKFKLLPYQFDNKLLPAAKAYCRTVNFLMNRF